jgi:hypothetical protein
VQATARVSAPAKQVCWRLRAPVAVGLRPQAPLDWAPRRAPAVASASVCLWALRGAARGLFAARLRAPVAEGPGPQALLYRAPRRAPAVASASVCSLAPGLLAARGRAPVVLGSRALAQRYWAPPKQARGLPAASFGSQAGGLPPGVRALGLWEFAYGPSEAPPAQAG